MGSVTKDGSVKAKAGRKQVVWNPQELAFLVEFTVAYNIAATPG